MGKMHLSPPESHWPGERSNSLAAAAIRKSPPLRLCDRWQTRAAIIQGDQAMWLLAFGLLPGQALVGKPGDRHRRIVGDSEHRANVDLAQHIGILTRRGARSIQKVGVPDDRQ